MTCVSSFVSMYLPVVHARLQQACSFLAEGNAVPYIISGRRLHAACVQGLLHGQAPKALPPGASLSNHWQQPTELLDLKHNQNLHTFILLSWKCAQIFVQVREDLTCIAEDMQLVHHIAAQQLIITTLILSSSNAVHLSFQHHAA